MMDAGAPNQLVEQTLIALRSITSPDDVAHGTREIADEIDRTWRRSPWVAGLAGDLLARTELINHVTGEHVFDPFARAIGSAALRVRHGAITRYRVIHTSGTVNEKPMPAPEDEETTLDLRGDEVRGQVAIHETALVTTERSLPALLRERPKPWAIWLWLMRWLLVLVYRGKLLAIRRTSASLTESRRTLAGIDGLVATREARKRAIRDEYFGELRVLSSGGPAGHDIRAVELEIAGGLLPEDIELVEMSGSLRAGADVDAVFNIERDGLYAPSPSGAAVRIGEVAELISLLPTALARARALDLAGRARDKLGVARAEINVEVDRAEAAFGARIERLEGLALQSDRTQFSAAQLERVRPSIVASVNAVMEHASVHLGSELAQLGSDWIDIVVRATTGDELKAAVGKIEDEWPSAARRIAEEVRTLVMGGAGGVARDLYPETVTTLRVHGLAEDHLRAQRKAPLVAMVDILPSLTNPSVAKLGGNWLTGLLKSFDSRKSDLREKVHARVEHIREVAAAELLDAEPKLHGAIGQALTGELAKAIDLQIAWHQQALAQEQTTISHERAALAPLFASRDAVIDQAVRLGRAIEALATDQPAAAPIAVAS